MTIKNKNIGDKNRKISGKKIMLVTALLSGGVVIRVKNHLDYSFANQSKEVINFDLTLESTEVLIDDSGTFYVGQGTPFDNFDIYDFVTIHDESGNVIPKSDVTLEWDIKEYFEGTSFDTKGEYLITITATTSDGRVGDLEYKLVVKEGHVFEEIKEIEDIEVDVNNTKDILDFQEHFRVLNSTTGADTGVPILSTLEDKDLQSVGSTQVIFYTELDGIKFTNSVHISVIDTVAPVVELADSFDKLNEYGYEWDKDGKTINIKDLEKETSDFLLDEFATAYDASGEYELSWDFDEVMSGNMEIINSKIVTVRAVDPSGNESTPIEMIVNVSTTTINLKSGFKEVAFDIFHDEILGSKNNHLAGYWFDIIDSNNQPVTDIKRISWTLTEDMLRELGEYTITIEVLDKEYKEIIGTKILKINVKDDLAPIATLVPHAKTVYEVEVSQNLSVDNLFMYLDGISGIEDLITVDENSGLWGYRFLYRDEEIIDETLRTVGTKSITIQLFDYDKDGNEANHTYLYEADGITPKVITFDIQDNTDPAVNVVNDVIDLEIVQRATKEMINIENYAEINDNSGSFTWDLRVKGSQNAVMDYENMLGKITDPSGVAIELVVTDASGNTTYRDMLLIVTDNEAPVIEVRKLEQEININPSASELEGYRNYKSYVNISDNSGKYDVLWDFDTVVKTNIAGTYEATVIATDYAGNSEEQIIKFTVVDNQKPVIIVNTKTITIEANQYTSVGDFEFDENLNDYITVTDNSGVKPNVTFDYSNVDFSELGTYEVIITATDNANNDITAIIEIKVIAGNPKVSVKENQKIVDTIDPNDQVIDGIKIYTKDGKVVIERSVAYETEILSHLTSENLLDFLTISGETIESSTFDLTNLDVTTVGNYEIQLEVRNNFNKITTETIDFVVIQEYDTEVKLIGDNFIDIEIDTNSGLDQATFETNYPVGNFVEFRAIGTGSTLSWDSTTLSNVNFDTVGTNVITATVTDSNGDRESISLSLNIIDTTAAEITVQELTKVEINSMNVNSYDVNTFVTATDNSGVTPTLSWNLPTEVDFTRVGTYTVTIKAIDSSGNVTTKDITFEVEDTMKPTLVVNPNMGIQTFEINSRNESQFNINSFVTATDNSGVLPELEWNLDSEVDFTTIGTYTVTIKAKDADGNEAVDVTIEFRIVDTIAPTIDIDSSGLEELKVEIATKSESDYSDWLEDYVTVTDNSGESITPSWNITNVRFDTAGRYEVVITAIDYETNSSTVKVVFVVADTTAPTITLKDNMETTEYEVFNQLGTNLSIDDFATCDDATNCIMSWDMSSVNFDRVGTYVVTIKAVDMYGNESIQEITIEVIDTVAPVIEITRADISVSMGKFISSDFNVNDFAKVTDNYDNSVVLTWDIDSVDFDSEGDNKVTISAIDSSGNEATEKIVTFTVQDNGMILNEKTPFVIEVDQSNEAINFDVNTYFEATREDGSSVDSIAWNLTDDMLITYGTHGVILTISFNSGNQVEVEVTLEVVDNTPPEITPIKTSETVELGVSTEFDSLTPEDFVNVKDNSNQVSLSWDFEAVVEQTVAGIYAVTITATDVAGNTEVETIDIIVEDTAKPTLELNDDFDRNNMIWSKEDKELSILAGDKTQAEIDLWEIIYATDLSTTPLSVSWDLTDLTNPNIHSNVIITVEDASGNFAEETITVILLKHTPILNNFSVDRTYNEITVDVNLTNLKQSISELHIIIKDSNDTEVDRYTQQNYGLDEFVPSISFNVDSNTEYNVVLEYTYATGANNNVDTTITKEQTVKTLAYTQNDILGTITDVYTKHLELTINYELSNEYDLLSSAKLVLLDKDGNVTAIPEHNIDTNSKTGTHTFVGLSANTEYQIVMKFEYDFNDGKGSSNKDADLKITQTLAYNEHDVTVNITGVSQSSSTVKMDYNITDVYGMIVPSGINAKIYNANDMTTAVQTISLTELNGSVEFIGLSQNTTYVVVIEVELDLKDNAGTITKEVGEQVTTLSQDFDKILITLDNVVVEYNEITFDYVAFDPSGLLVESSNGNKLQISINGQVFELVGMSGTVKLSNYIEVLSGVEYDVEIHFTYNLNDGNGDIIHDTGLYGFIESTNSYDVDSDLTLTSHNLSSDTETIYVDYTLRNLNNIGDMSTLSAIIAYGADYEKVYLKDYFGSVEAIPLDGQIKFSHINGSTLSVNTQYEISIVIDYDLKDGKGIQTDLLLLEEAEIKTQDQELDGYNVITTVDRGYSFLDIDFDIENTTEYANLLDSFKLAILDSDGNPIVGYDYISYSVATGSNNLKIENLLSDANFTIVYRVTNPNYTDGTNGHDEFIDITRSVSTRTYDTDLVDVEYDLNQGLTYLHLENIQIVDKNQDTEGINFSRVMILITYTKRDGQLVTLFDGEMNNLTELLFTDLESDRDATIEFRLEYDLNDGKGIQSGANELVRTNDTKTLSYDFTFRIENDEVIVTGLTPGFNKDEVMVYEEVEGYTVKYVEENAFYSSNINFSKITLPRSLETIGENAFRDVSLTEVEFTSVFESVPTVARKVSSYNTNLSLTIGDNAFRDNNLTLFDFGTAETIGASAFRNNNLSNVVIGDSVTYIGDEAFVNAGVLSLTVGGSLSDGDFGVNTFIGNEIKNLSVGNIGFKHNSLGTSGDVFDNTGFNLEFSDTAVGIIEEYTWYYKEAGVDSDYLNFSNVKINDLTIGSGIEEIERSAFYGNALEDIVIGDNVHTIGIHVFDNTGVQTVTLGNSLESIGQGSFANNNLTELVFPQTLTTIGVEAFANNDIEKLIIPNSVNSIAHRAFKDNGMTDLVIGSQLSDSAFGDDTFIGNKIKNLSVGNIGFKHNSLGTSGAVFDNTGFNLEFSDTAVGIIEEYTWYYKEAGVDADYLNFSNVKINDLTIGSGIEEIERSAFYGNALEDIVIGDNVHTIGIHVFDNTGVQTVTLGNSLESIGQGSFANNNLTELVFPQTLTTIGVEAFANNDIAKLIIPNSVNSIAHRAFRDNGMTDLVIGSQLSDGEFGDDTFIGNEIKNLSIGNIGFKHDSLGRSLNVFDNEGFNLEYADTASGKIEDFAWYYMEESNSAAIKYSNVQINNLTIGSGIEEIGTSAFYGNALEDIIIGDNVHTIGIHVFDNTGAKTVTLGNSLTSIGKSSFANNGLKSVIFPENLSTIGDSAFSGNSITELILPNSVSSIEKEAFKNNTINKLVIGSQLNDSAFGQNTFVGNQINNLTVGNIGFKHSSLGTSLDVFANTGFSLEYADTAVGTIQNEAWYYMSSTESGSSNYSNVKITNIKIGSGIEQIGSSAFYGNDLEDIVIGENVHTIGDKVFEMTGAETVTLGGSLVNIGKSSFANNELTTLVFPDNLSTIGESAFSGNVISELTIPNTVTSIGKEAFKDNSMTKLVIGSQLSDSAFGQNTFVGNQINNLTVGNIGFKHSSLGASLDVFANTGFSLEYADTAVGTIQNEAWYYMSSTEASSSNYSNVKITNIKIGSGVEQIGSSAFYGNDLEDIIIGENVHTIGDKVFEMTGAETVTLGGSLVNIGKSSFANNELTTLVFPDSVEMIGASAFENNGITTITLSSNLSNIGDNAFKQNKLTNINIPSNVSYLGSGSFEENLITTIDLGDGVTEIGANAFKNNKLTNYTIASQVEIIGSEAFVGNEIGEIVIHDVVNNVGSNAFSNNKMTKVTFEDGINSIGANAFSGNLLTNVDIPNSVTFIGDSAFENNNITRLLLGENVSINSVGTNTFKGNNIGELILSNPDVSHNTLGLSLDVFNHNGIKLEYTDNATGAIGSNYWYYMKEGENNAENFSNVQIIDLKMGSGVGTVGIASFYGNAIENLVIGDGVTTINDHAFRAMGIKTLVFGDSVTEIGNNVFSDNMLSSLTVDNTITKIGNNAFANNQLTILNLPNTITEIGEEAFYNNRLTNISIPDSVSEIRESAFENNLITQLTLGKLISNATLGLNTFTGNNISILKVSNVNMFHDSLGESLDVFNVSGLTLEYTDDAKGMLPRASWYYVPEGGSNYELYSNVQIKNLIMGTGVTEIDLQAFYGNDIKNLVLGENVTKVAAHSLRNAGIENLTLPGGKLVTIDSNAFSENNISELVIPSSLLTLAGSSFSNNSLLKRVTFMGGTVINAGAFNSSPVFYNASGGIIT